LNPVFLDEKEAKIVDWKFYRWANGKVFLS
jgi:hypothetical protein